MVVFGFRFVMITVAAAIIATAATMIMMRPVPLLFGVFGVVDGAVVVVAVVGAGCCWLRYMVVTGSCSMRYPLYVGYDVR